MNDVSECCFTGDRMGSYQIMIRNDLLEPLLRGACKKWDRFPYCNGSCSKMRSEPVRSEKGTSLCTVTLEMSTIRHHKTLPSAVTGVSEAASFWSVFSRTLFSPAFENPQFLYPLKPHEFVAALREPDFSQYTSVSLSASRSTSWVVLQLAQTAVFRCIAMISIIVRSGGTA
jgi:hypothetical protein